MIPDRKAAWTILVFGLPVLVTALGLWLVTDNLRREWENATDRELSRLGNHLLSAADTQTFWSNRFSRLLRHLERSKKPEKLLERYLVSSRKTFGIDCSAVLWSHSRSCSPFMTSDLASAPVVWNQVFPVFDQITSGTVPFREFQQRPGVDQINLLLGYIAFPRYLAAPGLGQFIPAAPFPGARFSWYRKGRSFSLFMQVPADAVAEPHGVRSRSRALGKGLKDGKSLGLLTRNASDAIEIEECAAGFPLRECLDLMGEYQKHLDPVISSPNHRWQVRFLAPRHYVVVAREKNWAARWGGSPILPGAVLLLFAGLLPWFFRPLQERLFGQPLFRDLLLLLFLANLLPLLVLWMGSEDFRSRKSRTIRLEQERQAQEFLRSLDNHFPLEYRVRERFLDGVAAEIDRRFSAARSWPDVQRWLVRKIAHLNPDHVLFHSSAEKVSLSRNGVFGKGFGEAEREEATYRDILEFILKILRGTGDGGGKGDFMETIIETVFRKPSRQVVRDCLESNGKIRPLGFGATPSPHYIRLFPSARGVPWERVFLVRFHDLSQDYLDRVLPNLNRNPHGLKIVTMQARWLLQYRTLEPASWEQAFWKRHLDFFLGLGEDFEIFPDPVNVDGMPMSMVGMRTRHLTGRYLAALWPLACVEDHRRVSDFEWRLLIGFNLVFSLSLAFLLKDRFLAPVEDLAAGVLALRQKDFSRRVPVRFDNELGDMAALFNRVVEESRDLQLARIVQTGLFPEEPLHKGHVTVFGRTATMGELGGDYFDYLEINERELVILVGDVVGHGLPAALMMAMAKALTLQCSHLLANPTEFLQILHSVVRATQAGKTARFLTFQLVRLDVETGTGTLINAGNPYPLLLRADGTCETWTTPSLPIGAMARSKFAQHAIELRPGDALFFMTDGAVEVRNPRGETLGYDRLEAIVRQSRDADPKVFWETSYQAFEQFKEGELAQDDLTMVVATYIPPSGAS